MMSVTTAPGGLCAPSAELAVQTERLLPYVPRLVVGWARDAPETLWKPISGTLAFMDISGFTSMTERLARKGKVGAEEIDGVLNTLFSELLAVAYDDGAGLVKWGGDAGVLLFDGPGHVERAARAAINMQKTIRRVGQITTSAGQVRLRMSIGMHTDDFDFYLVGDPEIHRELVLAGPGATTTVQMEQIAEAGEVIASPATAERLDPRTLGGRKDEGVFVRTAANIPFHSKPPVPDPSGVDIAGLIPVAIREHLLTGDEQGEHRRISAAFLEFLETDDLRARAGPHAVGEAIDACLRVVQGAALGHGVSFFDTDIARNAWRVMLIAGAPRSLGGNEDRMLSTLRAVIESDLPLPVRIGTNAGHVFAGHFGPEFRRTYSVKGDAVNTAARIMAKAEPGTIYSSGSVLDPAAALYETTALEPLAAKGKRHLLEAWSVGRRTGLKGGGLELPLVGRTPELTVFRRMIDAARAVRGGALELVGPAGIGKTRLLAELTTRASGFQILRALCEPHQQQIAYRAFRALLRAALDIPRAADNGVAAARLRERVEQLVPELLPWLPLLGVVIDVEMPSTREVEELGDEFKRRKLEEITAEFMSELLTEPTVIVIEDAHWLDEGSARLLAGLAGRIGNLPWVLAVTRRPETTGFVLVEGERRLSLLLPPLQPPEVESLVVAATEARPLRRHDIDALTERAAGNPLFLSQLLAGVLRTGSADDLPLTVESLVTEQVDRLPLRDRRILCFASVLGMAFSEELVWSLLELEQLERDPSVWTRLAEFLENTSPGRWRFRHALVREVAYEGLPFRRRRELHARAGLMILVAAGDPTEHAEVLSHHFFAAQLYFDAWEYSVVAGKRARAKYANADAAAFFMRAIDAARRGRRVAAADLAEVHEHLGDVRLILNEYDSARAAYAAGRRLVPDDPVTQARFLLQEAKTHCRGGRFADAIRSIRRGMRLLDDDRTPDARKISARLAALYAGTRASQGRFREAEMCCRRIIEASEEVGELEALARAYYILDFACMEQGRVDEAVYSAQSATLYKQLGDLSNQSEVISNSGVYAYLQGRWSEATELYAQSLELRRRLGDDAEAAVCAANLAEVLLDQGRLEQAEHLLPGVAMALHAGGYLPVEGFLAELLGRAAGQAGRLDEAMEHFASALTIFKRTGSRSHIFEIQVRIAEALVLAGRPEAALEAAEVARRITSELGGIAARLPLLHRVRAFAFIALGRADEARTALEKSIVAARDRRAVHEVGLSLDALVKLGRRLGEEPDPALVEESQSILKHLGVLHIDELPV